MSKQSGTGQVANAAFQVGSVLDHGRVSFIADTEVRAGVQEHLALLEDGLIEDTRVLDHLYELSHEHRLMLLRAPEVRAEPEREPGPEVSKRELHKLLELIRKLGHRLSSCHVICDAVFLSQKHPFVKTEGCFIG